MKTVKACGGEVLRLTDDEAQIRVKRGEAKYVPKSEWKALRPAMPAVHPVPVARVPKSARFASDAARLSNAEAILRPVPELEEKKP
jgi:hypothetical protein